MTAADHAVLVWKQLESEIRSRAPALLSRLLPPVSPLALARAETAIGVEFPDSVMAVYLVHDGIGMPAVLEQRTRASDLLPIAEVLEHWRSLSGLLEEGRFDDRAVERVRGAVKPDWYNRRWLPWRATARATTTASISTRPRVAIPGRSLLSVTTCPSAGSRHPISDLPRDAPRRGAMGCARRHHAEGLAALDSGPPLTAWAGHASMPCSMPIPAVAPAAALGPNWDVAEPSHGSYSREARSGSGGRRAAVRSPPAPLRPSLTARAGCASMLSSMPVPLSYSPPRLANVHARSVGG